MEINLCNSVSERVKIFVTARLNANKLTVAGSDTGKAVREWWNCDEYEYFYIFDQENTEKLFSALNAKPGNELQILANCFNGEGACQNLRNFCDEKDIKYIFDTWLSD